jgi:hypothetical protein
MLGRNLYIRCLKVASKYSAEVFVSVRLQRVAKGNATVKTIAFWLVIVLASFLLWQVVKILG